MLKHNIAATIIKVDNFNLEMFLNDWIFYTTHTKDAIMAYYKVWNEVNTTDNHITGKLKILKHCLDTFFTKQDWLVMREFIGSDPAIKIIALQK